MNIIFIFYIPYAPLLLTENTWRKELDENKSIILLIFSSGVLFLGILSITTFYEFELMNENIISQQVHDVDLSSSLFELRVNFMKNIVEMSSFRPEIMNSTIFPENITDQNKGISQNQEREMRKIATDMLEQDSGFEYFFYVLPDGDMYFLEPFEDQLDLVWLNYSFRDWYAGAIGTGSVYLSETYVSAATGNSVIAISIPVYDAESTEKKLNGIWVGTVDLFTVGKSFQDIHFDDEAYVLIVDNRNIIAVDSRRQVESTTIGEFEIDLRNKANLNTIEKTVEKINGVDTLIVFKSIKIGDKDWIVLHLQPQSNAFALADNLLSRFIIVSVIFIGLLGITGKIILLKINNTLKLKKEIEKIDVQKGEFSAMASHELKTPMVPIKGYLEMLLEPGLVGPVTPKQHEILSKIYESVETMEKLILKLLTVQRLDLGEMKWNVSEFDLVDLMDDVHSDNQSMMHPKKICFTNNTKDSAMISSDYAQIKEIFSNLIVNSVDFVSAGGKIDVDGKIMIAGDVDGNSVVFSVTDDGVGISKENQKNLFKKFYQVDTSVTRAHGGAGLGLSICKGLVEGLGGKIWINSDAGHGCSVYFSIPTVFTNNADHKVQKQVTDD